VRIVIEDSAEAAARRVAALVAACVAARPTAVLGLAAGRTMIPVYAELVRLHRAGALSLRGVTTFNLDEYVGAGPDAPFGFLRFVQTHLVERTDLRPEAVHSPDGLAADWRREAERYEGALRAAGGIDLQLIGIGRNGHLGFNEPGSSLRGRTRAAPLSRTTLEANRDQLAPLGANAPRAGISMGLGTILDARRCLLHAIGAEKARAVAAMIEGPLAARLPASVLQLHPDATVVLDPAAASELHDRSELADAERLQRELEERDGPG
jgi:glucosamine-6-phosphate deaminase